MILVAFAVLSMFTACKKEENEPTDGPHNPPVTFKYDVTNFNDGWTSTIKPDWVQVTKGDMKVLLHYPKEGTVFPADPDVLVAAAWNILVAPRYSNIRNYKSDYISDFERPEFGMATVTENATGKSVFVVLYRKAAGWIECVSPDKQAFINEFGFDPEAVPNDYAAVSISNKVQNMLGYNRFAVAATDINNTGKWSDQYSSNTFYYSYYTGSLVGSSTYTSAQFFVFGKNQSYYWELSAANSSGGQTTFVQAKSNGNFKSINEWQIQCSDIEGRPKTFDVYFSALKNGRALFMNDAQSPGSGVFTGFVYGK
ncbi:hypothetical protein MKQ68_25360 [Chitinophaga horti]|uniref:Uncharacterized protein n=1 Tax=Chitinophaga horti TaxID=2920382 RepID=A0ABY6J5G0_9BACT|nr:hypothetical protein [Chitinophaga horti]UYQ93414.1 hypothetical protein MKQ68_25360 [Chitinophaga horti]